MKAIWKNTVIAESDDTLVIEGNHYFPDDSVNRDLLVASETTTFCPWKGTARYYSVRIGGETNTNAAWSYPEPNPEADRIRERIAFWRGVKIVD